MQPEEFSAHFGVWSRSTGDAAFERGPPAIIRSPNY